MGQGDKFQTSLFFKKTLQEVKASSLQLSIVISLAYKKKQKYKPLDYWSRAMLNFDF